MSEGGPATVLYRVLLRLYPRAFRARFGAGMEETFAEELGSARTRGLPFVLVLYLRTLVQTPLLALEERMKGVLGAVGEASGVRRGEQGRATRLIDGVLQDVRFALRTVSRAPGFTVAAALTVALGVGATASLFSVTNSLLLKPLPVHEPDRLVRVHELRDRIRSSGMEGPRIPWERYLTYRESMSGVFDGVAAHNLRQLSLRAVGPAFPVTAVLSSGNYFDVLGVSAATGRLFLSDDEPVVVLGHRFWQQQFGGTRDVVGRTVHLNGQPYTVAGIAPPGFGGTIGFLYADLWVPYRAHGASAWSDAYVSPFARLRDGIEAPAAAAAASTIAQRIPPADDPEAVLEGVRLEPMTSAPGGIAGGMRAFLGLLLGTAFLVLLIAGANVTGMLLARSVNRRHEVAVRLALGVGRARLARQLVLEAIVLFLLGGVGGTLIAVWAGRLIARLRLPVSDPVMIDAMPDLRVIGFALAIAAATGVLFGLLPALQAARSAAAPALREGGRGASRRGARLGDLFVAGQLALSVLLLIVAMLFVRTLQQSLAMDPGFDAERVVVGATNLEPHDYDEERGRAFYAQLLARVRARPEVESASLAAVVLFTGESEVYGAWRATPGADGVRAGHSIVDEGYFETMRFELIAGRALTGNDGPGAPAVMVVNESFARRFWPGENPIGRTVLRGEEPHRVVGVVRDGAYVQFGEETTPFTFLSAGQRYTPRMALHVRHRAGASPGAVIDALRAEVAALDPDVALEHAMPLATGISFLLFPQRLAAILIGVFGLLGLVLAGIGVYGVLAHNVAQRIREFGIRIALGADGGTLLRLVLRRGVLLALAGTGAGLVAAAGVTRFLQSFLYGVSPMDTATFVAVPLLLGTVALTASLLPARRTLRMDPVESLRRE